MNHVSLYLCFNSTDVKWALQRLADELLPGFHGETAKHFSEEEPA